MKSFEIVHVRTGKGGSLYSIKFAGEALSELEKFYSSAEFQRRDDYSLVRRRLNRMVNVDGFRDNVDPEVSRWIAPISNVDDEVCELKGNSWEGIRLYCIRRGKILLIAGYAVVKRTQKIQDAPEQFAMMRVMREIDFLLADKLRDDEITMYADGRLKGRLTFIFEED